MAGKFQGYYISWIVEKNAPEVIFMVLIFVTAARLATPVFVCMCKLVVINFWRVKFSWLLSQPQKTHEN